MKEISIKEIEGIQIGQTENQEAATGCTVILCEKGMRAGIDVVGTLAAMVISEAIIKAITSSKGAYGLKGYEDLKAIQ